MQRRSYHGSATDPSVVLAKLPNSTVPQFPFLEADMCLTGILRGFVSGKAASSVQQEPELSVGLQKDIRYITKFQLQLGKLNRDGFEFCFQAFQNLS